jgi:hypothetical protein
MKQLPNSFWFRTQSDTGSIAKTYVIYKEAIDIYQLTLANESEVENLSKQGFYIVKIFKDRSLMLKPMHFKTQTFFKIVEGLIELQNLKHKDQ